VQVEDHFVFHRHFKTGKLMGLPSPAQGKSFCTAPEGRIPVFLRFLKFIGASEKVFGQLGGSMNDIDQTDNLDSVVRKHPFLAGIAVAVRVPSRADRRLCEPIQSFRRRQPRPLGGGSG
jgi:hypothetical protein